MWLIEVGVFDISTFRTAIGHKKGSYHVSETNQQFTILIPSWFKKVIDCQYIMEICSITGLNNNLVFNTLFNFGNIINSFYKRIKQIKR